MGGDALLQWKFMFDRYKELDIFKLDVIARELKMVLKKVGRVEASTKSLRDDAGRVLKEFGDKQHFTEHSNTLQDQCKQAEAHIHDVIFKCFSEKQRMHIGVAIDNEYKADDRRDGRLLEAGSMIYSVQEEVDRSALASLPNVGADQVERPDYGKSRAAKLHREDAVKAAPAQYEVLGKS